MPPSGHCAMVVTTSLEQPQEVSLVAEPGRKMHQPKVFPLISGFSQSIYQLAANSMISVTNTTMGSSACCSRTVRIINVRKTGFISRLRMEAFNAER